MTTSRSSGLGRCSADQAAMLKALMSKGIAQDVSARLVGVNCGRANDVLHERRFKDVPPANDNELRAYLEASSIQFAKIVAGI